MKLAIDFDGTCTDNAWPDIGQDVPGAVEALHELSAQGHQLILWTCREGQTLDEAVQWFADRQIDLAGVNEAPGQTPGQRKVWADIYIDDKAAGAPLLHLYGFNAPVIDWASVLWLIAAINITR